MGCCDSKEERNEPLLKDSKQGYRTVEERPQSMIMNTGNNNNTSSSSQVSGSYMNNNNNNGSNMNGSNVTEDPAEAVIQRTQNELINVQVASTSAGSMSSNIMNTREGEKRGNEYKAIAMSKGIDVPSAIAVIGVPGTPMSTTSSLGGRVGSSIPNNNNVGVISSPASNNTPISLSATNNSVGVNSIQQQSTVPTLNDAELMDALAQQVTAGINEVHVRDVGKIVSTLPVTE
jgi:hypothetical protein